MLSGELQRIATGMEQLLAAAANTPEALREDAAQWLQRLEGASPGVAEKGASSR
jgi:hypothetical protein